MQILNFSFQISNFDFALRILVSNFQFLFWITILNSEFNVGFGSLHWATLDLSIAWEQVKQNGKSVRTHFCP